ncbi:class I SAM-dependent methyltransferase [Pseudonocardia sp. CA-107938]|uniref:class I SAM-dependent methyltransferase n=1 Tax=Pseudonocardia sp. CA-107938 TaxID=3240021 RepID=UPI003D922BA6
MSAAAAHWARLQEGRGIPAAILAQAPADPWGFDPAAFRAPAVAQDTPSRAAALELLGAGGTVLDVGCGGGDAAFALAARATHVTGVDAQQDMLDLFAADAIARGIPHRTVLGAWPGSAAAAGPADVVVSHLVLHNVVDLPPFVSALTAAARRGVVVEMLCEHPMAWLDPLWERFHGLHRPPPATDADALAVLRECGIEPTVTSWERSARPPADPEWVARRLCLAAERVPEVAAALPGLPRPNRVATLTWTV